MGGKTHPKDSYLSKESAFLIAHITPKATITAPATAVKSAVSIVGTVKAAEALEAKATTAVEAKTKRERIDNFFIIEPLRKVFGLKLKNQISFKCQKLNFRFYMQKRLIFFDKFSTSFKTV